MNTTLLTSQRNLLALIQSGLAFTKDPFDRDRYEKLQKLLVDQMAQNLQTESATLTPVVTTDAGYVTPKLDVRALIKQADQILLVQDNRTKTWALPGGFADVGYSPSENIQREVLEETGLHVRVRGLLNVFDTAKRPDIPQVFQYYKLVFACDVVTGHFEQNIEVTRTDYFDPHHLPPLSLKRTTPEQLQALLQVAAPLPID